VFRVAYGLFYGSTPALIPAFAQAYNATDRRAATLYAASQPTPQFPAPATSIVLSEPPSIVVVDPSFTVPRTRQASAGWEFEKYRVGSIGIDYLFARGENLARPVDINTPGQFPGVNRVVSFESTGESLYNGVTFHIRARLLQQLFYTIAYTFARVDETPLEPMTAPFGGLNERASLSQMGSTPGTRAPGRNDQHHHASVSALYDTTLLVEDRHGLSRALLGNWEAGVVYTIQSGQPYSAFINGDLNEDGNPSNDLAPGTTWNQYRLPWQASIDPRIARRFSLGGTRQLALIWEAFNVTNRPNVISVDTTMASLSGAGLVPNPQFGRKTGQAAPRVMQVAARLMF
jgi:hypothetical protein